MNKLLRTGEAFKVLPSEARQVLKRFFGWKKKFRKVKKALRGSRKDPFLYLGIISVILLGVVSLGSGPILKSLSNQGIFSFTAEVSKIFDKDSAQSSFVGSIKSQPESPDLSLIQKNSLLASVPPGIVTSQVLGAIIGESGIRKEIIEYLVEEGDSLWSIGVKFNISIDTIVWANNIESALIRPGQKLLILPVSGVMHLVKAGETVSGIAEKYQTKSEKIISFNDLAGEGDIFEGEVLVIPDGKMPQISEIQPVDSSALARLSTNNFYGMSHDYPYGQCTWWVAQKRAIPSWGHAKNWLNNAIASGLAVCKGRYCTPRTGSVISLRGHRVYGHVGYVERVRGDKVIFSEMNYIGWGRMNYRTLRIGSPLIQGYIY